MLVAADARDLLHEVLGPLHVVPPPGHPPRVGRPGDEAERRQDGANLLLRHRRAQQPLGVARTQGHDPRLGGPRVHVDAPRADRRPGQLGHQRRGVVEHLGEHRAVHAPLEAVRGLAVQLVPARHPPDGARVPVRGLEQDPGRLVAHLGVGAAHRAGQRLRAAHVLDDQIIGDERPLLAVERDQRLALAARRTLDDLRPAILSRSKACIGWPSSSIT